MLSNKGFLVFSVSFIAMLVAGFLCFDVFGIALHSDELIDKMLKGIVLRGVFSVYAVGLLLYLQIGCFGFRGITNRAVLFLIPCFFIAINNFPFIDFFMDKLVVNRADLIWLFALECLIVGLMEELLFRGFIFSCFLKKFNKTKKELFFAVLFSSAVFGLFHLVNLLDGASILPVLAQIGYSFLLGGMLAIILLKTKNIWCCVVLHALYNFGGLLFPVLGGGLVWSALEIMLTCVVAVLVAGFVVFSFIRTEKFYSKELIGKL